MSKKLTKSSYIFYGFGVAYFMLDQIFNQFVQYYYLPPESAAIRGLKPIISHSYLVIAFIIMRIVDAIADPVVGYLSDNSKSKLGRRSIFMLIGILPLALSMVLFFFPIKSSELVVTIYLSIIGSIYFIGYTLVGGPYNALVADLASNKLERLNLSTVQSIFRLVFTAFPLIFSTILIKVLQNISKSSYGVELSFENGMRIIISFFSILATIFVLISIFGLKEKEIAIDRTINAKKVELKDYVKYLKNKEIILYFIGLLFFFAGFNIIRNSVLYYVTEILGREESSAFLPTAILFIVSAIFFPITQKLSKLWDYRRVMLIDLLLIIIGTVLLITYGNANNIVFYGAFILVGMGVSGAGFIFPPAMLSEISNSLYEKYNISIEGMMFGIQGLFLKLAFLLQLVVSTLIMPIGSKTGAATKFGIITTLFIAIIFLAISYVSYFMKKNEI